MGLRLGKNHRHPRPRLLQLHPENRLLHPEHILEKMRQRIECLLLCRIGAILVIYHRRQEPRRRFHFHRLALIPGKHRIARRPCAVALLGPPSQSPPRTRRMHRRPQSLRQAPMVRPRLHTGTQPIQIPLDRVRPLFKLPFLAWLALAHHFRPPKHLRLLPARPQFMPHPEIFKPLQNQQKTSPFLLRQPAKPGQIFPPAPACLARHRRIHGGKIVIKGHFVNPNLLFMRIFVQMNRGWDNLSQSVDAATCPDPSLESPGQI